MKQKKTILLLLITLFLFSGCFNKNNDTPGQSDQSNESEKYFFPLSLKNEMVAGLNRSYKWILGNQKENGSWMEDPAITSLVLYSIVLDPGHVDFYIDSEEAVALGYKYLEKFIKPDGGIYGEKYRNYTTALALMAFTAYNNVKYSKIIKSAKDFLIEFQLDESEDIDENNPFYGGIGYGGDTRPDLSNTQLALEAIKSAEEFEKKYDTIISDARKVLEEPHSPRAEHWRKALVFLARCQNVKGVNTMDYRTDDDGGFMYETGKYKPERSHSYGSMTYAGVKSLLYADVDQSDIRVVRALEWIKNNYTLDENPGFDNTSLYYYFMTFSKCLKELNQHVIVDSSGHENFWREDIVKKIISLQKPEGFWVNEDGRYWENLPELSSAYALVAMKMALNGLNNDNIK